MSKADTVAAEYAKENGILGLDYEQIYDAVKYGYHQVEKDVTEAFARIIRGNLSGIGNGIQKEFERIYTKTTGKKMYGGFKD